MIKIVVTNVDNFADMIRGIRTARGLSIRETSLKTGIDVSTISRWEHGKRKPTIDLFERYVSALDVELLLLEK